MQSIKVLYRGYSFCMQIGPCCELQARRVDVIYGTGLGSSAGDHDAGTPSSRKDSETSKSSALTSHYVRLSTIHPIHGDLFSHHSIDRESRTEDAYAFSELDGCGQS